MAEKVRALDFDFGIGQKLNFTVKLEQFVSPVTPVYEWVGDKIRGGVVDKQGTYHWTREPFETVEEFRSYMIQFKLEGQE